MLVASADHPKTYLLAAMGLHGGQEGWNAVTSEYQRWAGAYGEAAVLAAATAVMKAPQFYSGRVQDPGNPGNDYADPYVAFEMVVSRTNDPGAFVRAAIAFEKGNDTQARRSARYTELSAVRGEAALLDAARHAIALHASSPADRSQDQARMLGRLRIRWVRPRRRFASWPPVPWSPPRSRRQRWCRTRSTSHGLRSKLARRSRWSKRSAS